MRKHKKAVPESEIRKYMAQLFSWRGDIESATRIVKAILEADSPRISDVAREMGATEEAGRKAIHRFLRDCETDPRDVLKYFYQEDAEYAICDLTEVPRRQAKRTAYVGLLEDGKTRGYDLVSLSCPYRGRAIPFFLQSYSSSTLANEVTSRNQERLRAWEAVAGLLEETPLLLDRDYSSEEDLEAMQLFKIKAVIRLNTGDRPTLTHLPGEKHRRVSYALKKGEKKSYRAVYYKGKIRVNLIGTWDPACAEPLWVMMLPAIEPEAGLALYQKRMKIEQQFRDLKTLLHLEKMMNKKRENMEKMTAMVMIAYAVATLIGERVRDRLYRGRGKKRWLYSGPFVLLKQVIQLSLQEWHEALGLAFETFLGILHGPAVSQLMG